MFTRNGWVTGQMNEGKKFEAAFKASVPDDCLIYRLPDPAQSFSGVGHLRFAPKNPFDFLIWNPKEKRLFALELKTVGGKSISFERSKEEHGEIHYYQADGLNLWSKYDGITAGFVIEFREIETTIFIDIHEYNRMADVVTKKSFTINDLESNEINYIVIPQRKLRSRFRYDVVSFIHKS